MKKAVMIYNPNSGLVDLFRNKNKIDIKRCVRIFEKYGYQVELYKTKYSGHTCEIVSSLEENIDFVVSVGGDGTFNEAMTGNFSRKNKLVMSHIPLGTTNDIGAMFGLGKNLYKNLELILDGEVKGVDICTINHQSFVYVAGFGKFMNVPYETSRGLKKNLGKLAYLVEGIRDFFYRSTPLYEISYTVNDEKYHGLYSFALISNANQIAGIPNFYKNIKLDDHKFEVLFCNVEKKKDIIKSLLYLGANDITKVPGFYFHKCECLKIIFHKKLKKPWCIDGEEFQEKSLEYDIRIVPDVLIRIPKKVIPKLFVQGSDDV